MCGRFNVIDNPELQQLLEELGIELALPTAVNVAPTDTIAVITEPEPGQRELHPMRWWLTPAWAPEITTKYSMFNAKSETLATSRAFKRPFARQRGVVPVSSCIEWKTEAGRKQPFLIAGEDRALALAAIWDRWQREDAELLSCALITTAAAPEFADIHHRMPVLLDAQGANDWLHAESPPELLRSLFTDQLSHDLVITPINPGVNNSRNKDPAMLEPTGPSRHIAA